jgi:hypothetical protein
MCVDVRYPSSRFLARNEAILASVLVQVVYKTVLGTTTASLGNATLSASWHPTLPMLTNSILGGCSTVARDRSRCASSPLPGPRVSTAST